jgi:hypothetical protein
LHLAKRLKHIEEELAAIKRRLEGPDDRPKISSLKGIWKGMNITEQNIRQSRL